MTTRFIFLLSFILAAPTVSFASRMVGPYAYSTRDSWQTLPRVVRVRHIHHVRRAPYDSRIDPRMVRAAKIAEKRAERRSIRRCWRYVKKALLHANAVNSYPGTIYAKQAGQELTRRHGFRKIHVRNPYRAPIGAVLVYGGRGAGHVEIRTAHGFVSDYRSRRPAGLPLLGVYVKLS